MSTSEKHRYANIDDVHTIYVADKGYNIKYCQFDDYSIQLSIGGYGVLIPSERKTFTEAALLLFKDWHLNAIEDLEKRILLADKWEVYGEISSQDPHRFIVLWTQGITHTIGIYNSEFEALKAVTRYVTNEKITDSKLRVIQTNFFLSLKKSIRDRFAVEFTPDLFNEVMFNEWEESSDAEGLQEIKDYISNEGLYAIEETTSSEVFHFDKYQNWDMDNLYKTIDHLFQDCMGDI